MSKCDKLKPLVFSINDLAYIDESAVVKNFDNPHDHAVYKATEVDEAIAELKAENERLKNWPHTDNTKVIELLEQKLEDAKATAYAESVDAGMANKKLQDELTKLKAQMPEYKKFIEDEEFRKKLVDEYAGYVYEWAGHRYVATPYINIFIKGIFRALWLARAERAKMEIHRDYPYEWTEARIKCWKRCEQLCRAKAEEYK